MSPSQVILVAGYDYQHRNATLFRRKCVNRVEYLMRKSRLTDIRFVLFDVAAGKVVTNENGQRSKDGELAWQLIEPTELDVASPLSGSQPFEPVDPSKHYVDHGLIHDKKVVEHLMSMTDVYRFVQRIGTRSPGTLRELHIFSHGWHEGPILLNSSDLEEHCIRGEWRQRDVVDKDGRMKDFAIKNMPSRKAEALKRAFSKDGVIWVWGCQVNSLYRFIFEQIIDRNRRSFMRASPNEDNLVFNFKFKNWPDARDKYLDSQRENFNVDFFPDPAALTNSLEFNRYLWAVRRFLIAGLKLSYAARIATATGVVTYGTLPGMEAAFDAQDGLMEVLKDLADQGAMLAFYKRFVGVRQDPEGRGGRGYGTFDSKLFASIGPIDMNAC